MPKRRAHLALNRQDCPDRCGFCRNSPPKSGALNQAPGDLQPMFPIGPAIVAVLAIRHLSRPAEENAVKKNSAKKSYKRRKLFIDRPLQLAVLLRTALYWAMCTMAQVLMVLFFGIISSSQNDFPSLHPQVIWHLQITLLAS